MKKSTLKMFLYIFVLTGIYSCGNDDGKYTEVPDPESPVVVDLDAVPYAKLSDYKFYEGDMKNLEPALKVLPYDLNSVLFTDYAHKKRFVWMPEGSTATYNTDGTILEFPSGTVLIKNFYYDEVQPGNTTRIIETRLMIKKNNDWIFANYVWNESQDEATLDMNGSFTNITWNEGGTTKTTSYRIPSGVECLTCHKNGSDPIPIGPKPQNLNKTYNYADGAQNQLSRWIDEGYLANTVPENIASTIDWKDTSKPLELRVRSYLDINCAHCHAEGSHCDYRPLRLAFSETADPINLGVCVQPHEFLNQSQTYIVAKKSPIRSVMHYRLNSTLEAERMPLLGRTLVHDEAVDMIEEWISTMDAPCP